MKNSKLIILIALSILLLTSGTMGVYAYLTATTKSDPVTFTLGDVKLQTTNSPWEYTPIVIKNAKSLSNDLVEGKTLTSDLNIDNLRPGDAFKKEITINYTGSLESKLKITKGNLLSNSPFILSIEPINHDSAIKISKDSKDNNTWYVENVKQNASLKFNVRLEVPTNITACTSGNFTLSNNAFKLLDITATQWNNPTYSN
ncbi:SipW-dependent-type signal peptide-containing protein [Clostridium sp. YIM B02551]|uniref:SipW-dependent-type signal peptide-containing protein n=1 Tax=Clostridium sp. YIM B02551 TaxID=2910679 RepID=UPI001EEA2751|nr:SipW-dependent-type signal peptide-containing protein [Clostridium sp. YIM B02551]